MRISRNLPICFCLTAAVAAAFVLSIFSLRCSPESDFCGEGNPVNLGTQFCYDGRAYDLCEGEKYDPATHGCEYGLLKKRCGARLYDEAVQFCHTDGGVYDRCLNDPDFDYGNYNPATGCSARCGNFPIDAETQFCHNGRAYAKCGGLEYDPESQECFYGEVRDK
jgi:hypothetical protein